MIKGVLQVEGMLPDRHSDAQKHWTNGNCNNKYRIIFIFLRSLNGSQLKQRQ